MDRYWHITWTMYGTRVAGHARGFVSNVYAEDGGPEVRHNIPGTDCDADIPGLERYVCEHMLADPYFLNADQAAVLISQYQDTSRIRGYELCVASVMADHTHLVIGVPGDPDPDHLRELYKTWATRALKARWPLPASGTFFTAKGSVRKKADVDALGQAVIYVARQQDNPLATFVGENWQAFVAEYDHQRQKASGCP
jgi:REP element-mobilizing transposase RayT